MKMKDKTRQLCRINRVRTFEAFSSSKPSRHLISPNKKQKASDFRFRSSQVEAQRARRLAMAVALASLASSALASLAAALIAIWLCSRFVLPRIISFAVRRLRDRPREFVSPEKTRVSAASSS